MSRLPLLSVAALLVAAPGSVLRVRASAVVAPCVGAAARAWAPTGGRVQIETARPLAAGPFDVLVASAVEMTRALEGGAAEDGTEEDVARVPWVLQVAPRASQAVRSAHDLREAAVVVTVPDSPAAYEARRWAQAKSGKVREAGGRELREAAVALLPLSLAGPGEKLPVEDVPALVVRAAVSVRPPDPERARAFVRFLASERGQAAFAECRAE